MRFLTLFITIFAFGILTTGAARTADYKFSTSIEATNITISSITVSASDDVINEDELWGPRDIEQLKKNLVKKISSRLDKNKLMNDGGARLELTIIDLAPNRPTMQAYTRRPGLDFRSFGLGGAEVEAHIIAADGTDLGKIRYRYFASYLDHHSSGLTTWYDARRSFDKFSRRLVKELATEPSS